MRRLITLAGTALVLAGAVLFIAARDSETKAGTTYKIVFDNAFGLTEGGDFRVGGVKAGTTSSFRATSSSPPKAVVTAKITEPGFASFRKNASCTIKPQSLIGEYFVDCQPGSGSSPRLKNNATIPVAQTSSTIPVDLVQNTFREPYKQRFRLIVNELGTGLAGRPQDLSAVLRRAHPGLRETQKTLQILGNQNRTIANFISDSDTVVNQLDARKRDVNRFIDEAGDTAEIAASRREELRGTIRRLPRFLDELTPTMQRLGQFTDETNPLLTDAQRAAPSLNTFLARLGPFANAARPAVRTLGDASKKGTAALRNGRQEISELQRVGSAAPAAAKPLAQTLDSLDDRRRAIDTDARGKVGAPPASDVSNRGQPNNGGFTGLESVWTYFFWQTMSLNGVDNLGHILRVGATVSECSPLQRDTLQNNPSLAGLYSRCNSWLGPNQPGNTTADFTQTGTAAARAASSSGAGKLDAEPKPGQKDISKPQITLPPALQQLQKQLGGGQQTTPAAPQQSQQPAPAAQPQSQAQQPQQGGPSSQQLLDFLLGG